ncbi:MAG TPA: hypothetical protein VGO04_03420 [Ensifer sp.]|jgi:hypothetical protein|uniref:hypothetical protein n=1 Tax=Ensifer sp. TaxID=1872086 RepID=UPI002E0F663A|nr:hypothetical protein [Ensifer sp.]
MDTMAMVFIVDLALKNRRWDEDFDPKPPGLLKRILCAVTATIAASRARRPTADEKCTAQPCGHAVQY